MTLNGIFFCTPSTLCCYLQWLTVTKANLRSVNIQTERFLFNVSLFCYPCPYSVWYSIFHKHKWFAIFDTTGKRLLKTGSILERTANLYLLFRKLLRLQPWYNLFLYFIFKLFYAYFYSILKQPWCHLTSYNHCASPPRISLWTMKLIHLLPCSVLRNYNGTFWTYAHMLFHFFICSPLFRNIIRCCYIMVDFATAASQNGFSARSFPLYKKTNVNQKMTKSIRFLTTFHFYRRAVVNKIIS